MLSAVIGDILQPTHLLFVLVIALLVLGPKKLPEVGRSLGRGIRDFRNALSGDEHEPPTALAHTMSEPTVVASPQPVVAQAPSPMGTTDVPVSTVATEAPTPAPAAASETFESVR